ncbi:HIT family protein [Kitasatospora acidiphila]|uniref:HIT family protein n=1 Tax=Kitasatospora acidiphila TaxID=2567942 RepID=A0A540WDJ3_9ACTN|nr:HIT family protein [Kitasatospora acidiphila]
MSLTFDPQWLSRYAAQDPVANTESSCVFCGIVRGEVDAHVIAETADTLCFLDHLPATYGHVLVVPKQHCRDLFDIPEESFQHVMAAAKQVANSLQDSCGASGINLVHATGQAAHQTVFHFHIHVVPRYDGDSIVVFPRLADPARKEEVAQRLRTALNNPLPPKAEAESSQS